MKCAYLTRVLLHYGGDSFNHHLRFGNSVFRDDVTGRKAWEYFREGQIFCYVRWETNAYGTKYWRLSVLEAVGETGAVFRMKGVDPGAQILLDVKGVDRVRKAYSVIDNIEKLAIDPAAISPDYFLYAHQMLNTGLPVRPCTKAHHRAYLKAGRLADTEVHSCKKHP